MQHGDLAVFGQVNTFMTVPATPREEVNFHNIWLSISSEPENADANGAGFWVLQVLQEGNAIPTWSLAGVQTEDDNAKIVACGVLAAANQGPGNYTTQIKTSRTLMPGDRLVLSYNVHGLTAGNMSVNLLLCAHTTRK